ncbi:MAG: type III pantothenate kinase [Burkholderiaceae bacterium]
MLLLVDAGNTRIKWALVDAATELGRWRASGSVSHAEVGTLAQTWQGLQFSRALLSNVAGATLHQSLEAALTGAGLQPRQTAWFASTLQMAGVKNGYLDPTQLGCDRFASLIGAHALFPLQALIVATCGTATTVDALSADGVFVGGMILPGLGLMASALAKNTAQLPQVADGLPELSLSQAFADNTDAAIVAGCLAGQAGAIERAVAAHAQQHETVLCVVAGGAAAYIAPQLRVPHKTVDNLVLIGLQTVALQGMDRDMDLDTETPC